MRGMVESEYFFSCVGLVGLMLLYDLDAPNFLEKSMIVIVRFKLMIIVIIISSMPLYELIMITKSSQPATAVNFLKNVTNFVYDRGGNVREVKVLADR